MSLTNIEYGSIASSDILNKNFNFLDEKIISSKNAIDTDISSAMSNIASINLKLNDLSDEIADINSTLISRIKELKNEIQISLNEIAMTPNWKGVFTIENLSKYRVDYNGYLYLIPKDENAELKINDSTLKIVCSSFIPVKIGDVVDSSYDWQNIKFLPSTIVTFDNN